VARRRGSATPFLLDVCGALVRLSHRVPLVGAGFAAACGVGWWLLRQSDALYGTARIAGIALALIGGFFLLLAIVGLLRNLFPDPSEKRRAGR
jgi:hypothetical protein